MSEFHLDQVILRVKILPEKHKTIKLPLHFYGELVKTKPGAQFLKSKRHLDAFKQDIVTDNTSLKKKRAALWAIGHIGAHENGIELVTKADLIQPIINLAERADVLSLRGTCIYIIGMLSNTKTGKVYIEKLNWIASTSKGMQSVCLPKEPKTLFSIGPYDFEGQISGSDEIAQAFKAVKSSITLTKEEEEVITNIGNLLNSVYEQQAISELRKLMEKQ